MTSDDKAEVLALNETFYRAFEKRDLKGMSLIWWQGAGSLCIHPGGKVIQGWEGIRSSWDTIFRNTDYLEIETESVSLEVGQQIAYIVLVENVLQIDRGRRLQARSLATNIFTKMAQKWYLIHHHGSPIMRP